MAFGAAICSLSVTSIFLNSMLIVVTYQSKSVFHLIKWCSLLTWIYSSEQKKFLKQNLLINFFKIRFGHFILGKPFFCNKKTYFATKNLFSATNFFCNKLTFSCNKFSFFCNKFSLFCNKLQQIFLGVNVFVISLFFYWFVELVFI